MGSPKCQEETKGKENKWERWIREGGKKDAANVQHEVIAAKPSWPSAGEMCSSAASVEVFRS